MGAAASKRDEVVAAYRPFVKQLTGEMHKAFVSDANLAAAYKEAQKRFDDIDGNGDNQLSFDELRTAMHQQGFDADDPLAKEILQWQFQMCDADGSGSISLDEALYLFYNISSTLRQCKACRSMISPLIDAGYCCIKCHSEVADGLLQQQMVFDLCTQCYKKTLKPDCPQHGLASMRRTDVLLENCAPQDRAATCLPVPAVNRDMCSPHDLLCMSCGERHAIVLSYLRPDVKDLHMRPVYSKERKSGEETLKGFVCEFCAMRTCSLAGCNCMSHWWDTSSAAPSLCAEASHCSSSASAKAKQGSGEGVVNKKLAVAAEAAAHRLAAHCTTCHGKLYNGTKLWSCDAAVSSTASDSARSTNNKTDKDIPMTIVFGLSVLKDHTPIHKIGIKTAWTVWQPIGELQNAFAKKTVRHCFLVFKLTDGITDNGHKFLRVERQQDTGQEADSNNKTGMFGRAQTMLRHSTTGKQPVQPNPDDKEAVLKISVATTRSAALYMDTPAYHNNLDDLHQEDADKPGKPPYGVTCRHMIAFDSEKFKLGALLKILEEVHNRKPTYNLVDANCIWYVKAVLTKCLECGFVAPDSREAIKRVGHANLAADVGEAALDVVARAIGKAYKKTWASRD